MNRSGFSLIELLLVLAVVGILATLGFTSLLSAQQRARLQEAQTLITSELERARSSAQRLNTSQTVAWTAEGINGKRFGNGITLTSPPDSFVYTAPYGETTLEDGLELELEDGRGRVAKVAVIGVTGKVYRRSIE